MKKQKLVSNVFYNAIFQLLNIIIPVITIPYVSRIFSPGYMGIYGYMAAISQLFILIGLFGMTNYGGTIIANSKTLEERTKNFYQILFVQIIMTIVAVFVLAIGIYLFDPNKEAFYLFALFVFVSGFDITWLFVGVENFKQIAVRNLFVKIVILAMTFILVRSSKDFNLYIFLNALSVLVANFYMFYYARDYIGKLRIGKIFRKGMKEHFKVGCIFLLPQLITIIYTNFDRVILLFFSNTQEVGYYDQSQKIIRMVVGLLTSMSVVLMPRIAILRNENNMKQIRRLIQVFLDLTLFVSSLLVTYLVVIAPRFSTWFFGELYAPVSKSFVVSSFIMILIPISLLVTNAILIPFRKEKKIVVASIYAVLMSVIANVLLDTHFGALGAAIAILLAEIVALILRGYFAHRVVKFKILNRNNVRTLAATLISIPLLIEVNKMMKLPILVYFTLNLIAVIAIYLGITILFNTKPIKKYFKKHSNRRLA